MDLKISTARRVESFDADLHNRLKISSIFNYMQDIASRHADELGVGYEALLKNRIYWVLSWAKVAILSPLPSYGENMTIETWAKGKHRLFYMRDFIIRNGKGDIIVKATTAWLLLDAESGRMSSLERLGLELPSFPEEHAIEEYPGKFNFSLENEQVSSRKVLYSDIDINRHVNNSRYLEFILDCYNPREHDERSVRSLTISYKGETRFMDELSVSRSELAGRSDCDFVKAVRASDSKEIFHCLIEWE